MLSLQCFSVCQFGGYLVAIGLRTCDVNNRRSIFFDLFSVREPRLWETSSVVYTDMLWPPLEYESHRFFLKLKYHIGEGSDYWGMSIFQLCFSTVLYLEFGGDALAHRLNLDLHYNILG